MFKLPTLLASLLGILLLSTAAHAASLYPVDAASIQDNSNLSASDDQVQLSLTLGLRPLAAQSSAKLIPTPKLTLTPTTYAPNPDFVVGRDTLTLAQYAKRNWQTRPNFEMRDEWNFLRRQTIGPDNLERFADFLDIDEQDRPWATTTTVHLLATTNNKDWLVPFATIAHQIDADEDFERFGVGAGAMIILGKNANFGAEIIHYGGDRSQSNDAFSKETQFLTRLQIDF